jgi:hypothetical protein
VQLKLFILPLFLHVLLTLIVGIMSLRARVRSARSREVKLDQITNNNSAWPEHVRKLGNNFDNQFQAPMLWYSLTMLAIVLNRVDWVLVVLSWLVLAARIGHSYVHTGSNIIITRMKLFLLSFFTITAMWLWLAIRVFVLA